MDIFAQKKFCMGLKVPKKEERKINRLNLNSHHEGPQIRKKNMTHGRQNVN